MKKLIILINVLFLFSCSYESYDIINAIDEETINNTSVQKIHNVKIINQYDKNNKKQGYWEQYYTEDFKIINEKQKASYLIYVYYENDKIIWPTPNFNIIYYNPQRYKSATKFNKPIKDTIIQLYGKIDFYNKTDNTIASTYIFKNGILQSFTVYANEVTFEAEYWNYEKKYKNYQFSYIHQIYYENSNLDIQYLHFYENKEWKYFRIVKSPLIYVVDNITINSTIFNKLDIDYNSTHLILSKSRKKYPNKNINEVVEIQTKMPVVLNDSTILYSKNEKEALSNINDNNIDNILILDKKQSIKKYGWWRGRHGAIIIETKQKE